ncbi:hypothetical protein V1511DRAFT_487009 [Dipodascopsis uninucleata]
MDLKSIISPAPTAFFDLQRKCGSLKRQDLVEPSSSPVEYSGRRMSDPTGTCCDTDLTISTPESSTGSDHDEVPSNYTVASNSPMLTNRKDDDINTERQDDNRNSRQPTFQSSRSNSTITVPKIAHTENKINNQQQAGSNRRFAHILSEQRRRENINGGFLDLKSSIPHCRGSQDSKAVILKKAVSYISFLESEINRLKSDIYQRAPMTSQQQAPMPMQSTPLYYSQHGVVSMPPPHSMTTTVMSAPVTTSSINPHPAIHPIVRQGHMPTQSAMPDLRQQHAQYYASQQYSPVGVSQTPLEHISGPLPIVNPMHSAPSLTRQPARIPVPY